MELTKNITAEQLQHLNKQQEELQKLLTDLGLLEVRKHSRLHYLADLNKSIEEFKQALEDEYGPISINLATGEYTETTEDVKSN